MLAQGPHKHPLAVARIEAQREQVDKKSRAEDARWAKEQDKLERALGRSER